jgi:hypothetical protein
MLDLCRKHVKFVEKNAVAGILIGGNFQLRNLTEIERSCPNRAGRQV